MLDVATSELNIVDGNHALAAVFATRRFLTSMIARLVAALARLLTFEDIVHRLRVTTSLTTMSTV
jgi:hypothetical protein